MKGKFTHAAAIVSIIFSGIALAEGTPQQSAPAPTPAAGHAGAPDMAMGGMMSEDRLKKKQEYDLKIHDLSNRILSASTPAEKDRLKAEQLELMKAHQKEHHQMMQQMMMHKMGGGGMGAMPGMQHDGNGSAGGGSMGGMQHNTTPPAPGSSGTQGH